MKKEEPGNAVGAIVLVVVLRVIYTAFYFSGEVEKYVTNGFYVFGGILIVYVLVNHFIGERN